MSTKKWLAVVAASVFGTAVLFGYLPLAGLVPYALLLVCPLSMWFMMRAMGGMGGMGATPGDPAHEAPPTGSASTGTHIDGADPRKPEPAADPTVDSQYRR